MSACQKLVRTIRKGGEGRTVSQQHAPFSDRRARTVPLPAKRRHALFAALTDCVVAVVGVAEHRSGYATGWRVVERDSDEKAGWSVGLGTSQQSLLKYAQAEASSMSSSSSSPVRGHSRLPCLLALLARCFACVSLCVCGCRVCAHSKRGEPSAGAGRACVRESRAYESRACRRTPPGPRVCCTNRQQQSTG